MTEKGNAHVNAIAKWTGAIVLMLVAFVTGSAPAGAEPLTPLTPNEDQYLADLHRVFAVSRDDAEFRGDGELLDRGYYVCAQKANGIIGRPVNLVSPIINQLAVIYLCPN